MIVLGIDTGYAALGWALVDMKGTPLILDMGTIRTAGKFPDERFKKICSAAYVSGLDRCSLMAAEDPYGPLQGALRHGTCNAQNFRNIEVFGMFRNMAYTWGGIPFHTINAKSAKIAVCGKGAGNAGKAQIKRAVQAIPGCPKRLSEHAADAVAIAICAGRRERLRAGNACH